MERIKVKIINNSGYDLPTYETFSAAGMDVRAAIIESHLPEHDIFCVN